MNLAQQINQHGFRRWYERQLIEGHLYLVGAFLALIAMAATVESFEPRRGAAWAAGLLMLAATCGAVAFFAGRRFITLLARAETYAGGATCPGCGAWGKLRALGVAPEPESAHGPRWVNACCKRCGAHWRIADAPAAAPRARPL